MVSGSQQGNAKVEQFLDQRRRDSKTRRGVFSVGKDHVRGKFLAERGQQLFHHAPTGLPEYVANKENFHRKENFTRYRESPGLSWRRSSSERLKRAGAAGEFSQ